MVSGQGEGSASARSEPSAGLPRRPWEGLPQDALDVLAPHLPGLTEEIIETIRVEVPDYALPLTGTFGEGIRTGVQEALRQFAQMARDPGVGREVGREVYVRLGAGEARVGRSLEVLLSAYRIGARVAWRRLGAAGLEGGLPASSLLLLAEAIFAYIDELSAESAEGFAEEQAAQAGEAQRRREHLVALLLATSPADPTALAAAAQAAGWIAPQRVAVLAWPQDTPRRIAHRLPVGSLSAPVEGVVYAVVPDPDAPGRRAELEAAVGDTPAGLGPGAETADAARSREQAVAALRLASDRAGGGLVAAEDHRIALLLRSDPALLEALAADELAPLADLTDAARERVLATLMAWLRHQGATGQAAEELHVHPQTVRYRLGRLRELFGDALDDPDRRFALELVLRARAGEGS
jgi:hypothetical protein